MDGDMIDINLNVVNIIFAVCFPQDHWHWIEGRSFEDRLFVL